MLSSVWGSQYLPYPFRAVIDESPVKFNRENSFFRLSRQRSFDPVKHYLPPRRTIQCPPEKRRPTICWFVNAGFRQQQSGIVLEGPRGSLGGSSGGEEEEDLLHERNCGQLVYASSFVAIDTNASIDQGIENIGRM